MGKVINKHTGKYYRCIFKTLLLGLGFILMMPTLHAQKNACNNCTDSSEVIHLLKRKRLLLYNKNLTEEEIKHTPVYQPRMVFDSLQCQWTVTIINYKTTHRGDCKHTNGCTIVISKSITVDAETGKIIRKEVTSITLPNYE